MDAMHGSHGDVTRRSRHVVFVLGVLATAFVMQISGCAFKTVALFPNSKVLNTFDTVDIDPDKYAFFTTGPEATPEAVLLIENPYLGEYDSSGWKLRDKDFVMNLLRAISKKSGEAKKFGYAVQDDQGIVKGMLFMTAKSGKVFIDKEEGTFKVATPAMLDTGLGAAKRTSCSISICQ